MCHRVVQTKLFLVSLLLLLHLAVTAMSASIITVYRLADCSDQDGGVDVGVEAAYNPSEDNPQVNLYHQMNLTSRTCMAIPVAGIGQGLYASALYDCQYDPYTGLSTIIVVNWPRISSGNVPSNPTCNTTLAFLKQHNTFMGSYIQHSGFVNGQCTLLHEGTFGFANWVGADNALYARINCSMMIPNYEQLRQVTYQPINNVKRSSLSPSSSTLGPGVPSSSSSSTSPSSSSASSLLTPPSSSSSSWSPSSPSSSASSAQLSSATSSVSQLSSSGMAPASSTSTALSGDVPQSTNAASSVHLYVSAATAAAAAACVVAVLSLLAVA